LNIWRPVIVTLSAAIGLLSVPATINGAVAAFNKGDMNAWSTACASTTSIIDDFPPYTWGAPAACADWWTAFVAANKKNDMSWGTLVLGSGWHVAVTGNRAYTVFPAIYTYKMKGTPAKDSGVFTLVLTRTPAGWRVAAWSWAQR
jgi:hypothetical protein